ncbi:1374_t:CDS:2 [Acaulospora morrowiae]|uniref:1374_t:CDS:1 n=1 Tax=Acaulospora morrowiae TaxID=94023 RepID=A0A9N9F4N6_9GLOM|nr:1374_t:CDS:2 [Acaulospora morrowiae]
MSSSIGREPNSSVVFHALPKHDKDLPAEITDDDRPHWQDREHLVYPPNVKDRKGIVGHLEKDLEKEMQNRHKGDGDDHKKDESVKSNEKPKCNNNNEQGNQS